MNGWANLIKLPLYRVFMPVAVGVVFIFLVVIGKINIFSDNLSLKIFLECFNQTKIQVMEIGYNTKIVLPNFVIIVAILAICFVIGEICSMMGELIVNLFFCYCPLVPTTARNIGTETEDSYLMEKVFPCSEKWIKYQDFTSELGREGVAEVSEVHFVMSRLFAGLMIVSLATIISLEILILVIFVIIAICFCFKICKMFWQETCNICAFIVTIMIIFILLCCIIEYLNCDIKTIKHLNCDSLVSILFAIFFLLASLYYRSHANLLIYHRRFNNGQQGDGIQP